MELAKLACEIVLPSTAVLGLLWGRKQRDHENYGQDDPAPDPGLAERMRLRQLHGVRLVNGPEEGISIFRLPDRVYGFTYAPGAEDFGLFSSHHHLSFEVHKAGEALLLAYAKEQDADNLDQNEKFFSCELYPERRENATRLVAVPFTRIVKTRPLDRSRGNCLTVEIVPSTQRIGRVA